MTELGTYFAEDGVSCQSSWIDQKGWWKDGSYEVQLIRVRMVSLEGAEQ